MIVGEKGNGTPPRLSFFLLFLGFYVLGVILLLNSTFFLNIFSQETAQLKAVDTREQLSNTFIFSTLICLYTLLIAFIFRRWLHKEFISDSPYFMGFLFTLTSLSLSFYLMSGDDSLSPKITMMHAGIALITSIIGLIGRLFLSSMAWQETPASLSWTTAFKPITIERGLTKGADQLEMFPASKERGRLKVMMKNAVEGIAYAVFAVVVIPPAIIIIPFVGLGIFVGAVVRYIAKPSSGGGQNKEDSNGVA